MKLRTSLQLSSRPARCRGGETSTRRAPFYPATQTSPTQQSLLVGPAAGSGAVPNLATVRLTRMSHMEICNNPHSIIFPYLRGGWVTRGEGESLCTRMFLFFVCVCVCVCVCVFFYCLFLIFFLWFCLFLVCVCVFLL